jgi:hypothetical protein
MSYLEYYHAEQAAQGMQTDVDGYEMEKVRLHRSLGVVSCVS